MTTEAHGDQQALTGYSWPDVVMAIIDFARDDTATFAAVVFMLTLFLAGLATILYVLLPRATRLAEIAFQKERQSVRDSSDPTLPLGGPDNG